MTTSPYGWTLVQHSGYGYGNKIGWAKAVEIRRVPSAEALSKIRFNAGVVFPSWMDADAAEHITDFPDPEDKSWYPKVRGSFAKFKIDHLALYVPTQADLENYWASRYGMSVPCMCRYAMFLLPGEQCGTCRREYSSTIDDYQPTKEEVSS